MANTYSLGNFELSIFTDGAYLADGGAMFGVVPKVMWEKKAPADELNRIVLALNSLLIRTDGTLAPCFPMYSASFDWGNIDDFTFDDDQLNYMKKTCEKHCFSTLNHNLAYCYNDARVIKWMWENVRRGFRGGVRSFED